MWTEGLSCRGGRGEGMKYLTICIKKIYICKHILLYNYYTVYAYFIMDIIMHICILSFIYFNKRYIVHLYYFSDSLFFLLLITHLVMVCLLPLCG